MNEIESKPEGNKKGDVKTFPFLISIRFTLLLPIHQSTNRNSTLFILLLFFAAFVSASDQSFTLSTGFNYLYFEEKSTTNVKVKENGFLPALKLNIENQNVKQFSVAALNLSSGKIAYDGKTQSGIKTSSKSYATIADLNLKTGLWLRENTDYKTGLSIGMGYRYWDRAIQSTSTALGLREKYSWNYFTLGLHNYHQLQSKNNILLTADFVKPFNALMSIDHKNSFDSVKLVLKPQTSFRLTGEWQKKYSPDYSLTLSYTMEAWRMEKSNTEPLSVDGVPSAFSITEPASFSFQSGLTIGLKWK